MRVDVLAAVKPGVAGVNGKRIIANLPQTAGQCVKFPVYEIVGGQGTA